MPFPQNIETAAEVEQIIRDHGAVPATIALMDGMLCIGLDGTQLHRLATEHDVAKASRRDLPGLLAQKKIAATTVAATMIAAAMADIRIFATGGIGGVHRGAEKTFDISADLPELAQTPVAVVSAGAKAILDLPLTLEWLETHGVPVIGVGTDEFPAFYSRESGLRVPQRLNSPEAIAQLLKAQDSLGFQSGCLIANPIPQAWSMPAEQMNTLIEQAIEEANLQGISGKELTPFLLKRITELTAGKSLASNIELVKHNAALAANIAVAYAGL
jgi:pseudouridine-5'-phosphate glycosidase